MNRRFFNLAVCFILLVLLAACGTPTKEEVEEAATDPSKVSPLELEEPEPATTQITIDGDPSDWEGYEVLLTDPEGDHQDGGFDIAAVRAFTNDQYLYILIETHEPPTDYMQLDLNLEAGKRSFIVSFNPESSSAYLGEIISNQYNSIGEVAGSSSAAYQAVEFKILLSALGDAGSLTLLDVRPMNGVCCDENWYAIDNISPVPVAQLDEVEHASDKQQVCGGEPTQPRINFQLTEAGVDAELIWRTGFIPWWVRSSPDGRVLAVSDGGDAIYELKPDGSLAIAFQCPGVQIETFTGASDGALWFTSCDGGRLYRVDTSGEVRILAQHGNHNLEAGPNGEVYAMGEGLVRIAPDGSQEPITDQVKGRKFAVSPNGEIAAMKDDSVVLIADSGELKKLASGYGPEQWLAFDSDGLLYVTHWSGVDVINLTSGSITPIPWLVGSSPGESGTFAPDGRLLLYHPNVDVYAVDLVKETIDVYHQVTSNSRAMAIDPEGDIYIAYGDGQPNGETTIYRVVDNQTLELVLTVPYGLEHAMAFDQQGFGYLALADQTTGGAIIRFDLAAETFEVYYQSQCHLSALAVHPLTGQVWWEDCGRFYALGEDGDLVHIDGVPDARDTGLAITPDGALFTIGFFEAPDQNTPMKRYLYRYDQSAAQWEQIADLSQSDPAIMLATLTACPNGIIYTIESLDADHLPINRSSFNAVRRLEADGSLTLLGYDFSFDGEAAYCDPATGRILFTSGAGIFSLTPP